VDYLLTASEHGATRSDQFLNVSMSTASRTSAPIRGGRGGSTYFQRITNTISLQGFGRAGFAPKNEIHVMRASICLSVPPIHELNVSFASSSYMIIRIDVAASSALFDASNEKAFVHGSGYRKPQRNSQLSGLRQRFAPETVYRRKR
jgi:hypothetical protein